LNCTINEVKSAKKLTNVLKLHFWRVTKKGLTKKLSTKSCEAPYVRLKDVVAFDWAKKNPRLPDAPHHIAKKCGSLHFYGTLQIAIFFVLSWR